MIYKLHMNLNARLISSIHIIHPNKVYLPNITFFARSYSIAISIGNPHYSKVYGGFGKPHGNKFLVLNNNTSCQLHMSPHPYSQVFQAPKTAMTHS